MNFDFDLTIIKNEPVDLWLVAIPPSSWTQDVTDSNRDSFKPREGTTRYAAPEVLWRRPVEKNDTYLEDPFKVDVYSFGITAYEVLTGLNPFDRQKLTTKMFKKKIMDHDLDLAKDFFKTFKEETKNYPERFISFMQKCWAYDPEGRPSFQDIIEKIEEAKEDLITRSLESPVRCDTGQEQAKHPSSEPISSKHGKFYSLFSLRTRFKRAKTERKERKERAKKARIASKGRNNQVLKTPIPPLNPQLLMSTLLGHTQYVDIYNCSCIRIYSCIIVFVSQQWSILRTLFKEQLPGNGWIF